MAISDTKTKRGLRRHPAWRIGVLALAVAGIIVWAHSYYTERVFYVNQHKYKLAEADDASHYRSLSGPPIEVRNPATGTATVKIGQAEYALTKEESLPYIRYTVTDPEGQLAVVEEIDGNQTAYDENGERLPPIAIYVGNGKILEEGEWLYSPYAIVRAAYPHYHEKQGSLPLFLIAMLILIYGWCGFRYRLVQNALFHLSPSRWYVEDPEPSDFYYFMCKVSGIVTMLAAGWLFILSL